MQAVLAGDVAWAGICSEFETGVDCLVDEAGTVNELLDDPLPLSNVLDYGADPSGEPIPVCVAGRPKNIADQDLPALTHQFTYVVCHAT